MLFLWKKYKKKNQERKILQNKYKTDKKLNYTKIRPKNIQKFRPKIRENPGEKLKRKYSMLQF